MKFPRLITITVSDSTEHEKKHNLNTHFEILVRKLLNLFAKNPLAISAAQALLISEVSQYGSAEYGLENEILMTPVLCKAMMSNPKVSKYCIKLNLF